MLDLKFAIRQLLKNPGFTAVIVLTLALGIGANTAIFSVVNTVLLRPLPYTDSERLVMLSETQPAMGSARAAVTPVSFDFWREHGEAFQGLAALRFISWNLSGEGGQPERVQVARTTPGLFELLGVKPFLGRTFHSEDDRKGFNKVCILSHALWTRRFGNDPGIVGRFIDANGSRFQIVGVMPPDLRFFHPEHLAGWPEKLQEPDLWNPWPKDNYQDRWNATFLVVGRLKANVSSPQAQSEIKRLASQLAERFPDSHAGRTAEVIPLQNAIFSRSQESSLVLFAAVGILLLLTCANVANLLLARAVGRRREFSIRSALGASRWELMVQSCTEAMLLAALGGALGLLLGVWVIHLLPMMGDRTEPYLTELALDGRVLGFTFGVSLITGLVCGGVSGIRMGRINPGEALAGGGRNTGGYKRDRLRSWLVRSEVALALMLVIAASLMIESFANLLGVDPGFSRKDLVAVDVSLLDKRYQSVSEAVNFLRPLEDRLASLPGVESVGAGYGLPFGSMVSDTFATVVLSDASPFLGVTNFISGRMVSPGYFATLGVPVLQGRRFQNTDTTNAPPVVAVNEAFARRFFPGSNPIGQRVNFNDGGGNPCEIVGVVGNTRSTTLAIPPAPEVYRPIYQFCPYDFSLILRTRIDPSLMISSLRREVLDLDSNRPVYNVRTMQQEVSRSLTSHRFGAILMSSFGGLALLVAAFGVYGIVSYSVKQQTREIGVRIALGARSNDIVRLIVGQGLKLFVPGLLLGVLGTIAVTGSIASQLFGVSPADPSTFVLASSLLFLVSLLACLMPVWRGIRTDPMEALRHE